MHRAPPPPGVPPPAHHTATVDDPRRVSLGGLLRSLVAAGGAAGGLVIAVPLGAFLGVWLFEHVGVPVAEGIISGGAGGSGGDDWLESLVVGIFLAIAAIMVAVLVVAALVAPVFVVLPMLGTAVALRLTGAGLILRTMWLSLAAFVLLGVGTAALVEALDVRTHWWMWAAVVAVGSFAGRLVVEAWQPRAAGVRGPLTVTRRWKALVIVWLCLLVVAVAAGFGLFLVVV